MKIIKTIAPVFALALLATVAQPLLGAANQLEGVWDVRVSPDTPPGAPVLLTVATFGRDGSVTSLAGSALPPIPPIQAIGSQVTPSVGRWSRETDHEFRYSIVGLIQQNGTARGFQRITVSFTLNSTSHTFEGTASAEWFDADWNLQFAGCRSPIIDPHKSCYAAMRSYR
jgi:hypothetical protein